MACWVGLTVFALLKLCRYHQLENMRVSMFRERQRLINEGMGRTSTLDKNQKNQTVIDNNAPSTTAAAAPHAV